MKNRFLITHGLITLSAVVVAMSVPSAGYAAVDDGGFGGSTYFTAQTPDALGDKPTGNAFAAGATTDDADSVSKIEPAAGGDNNVFTLPEDPSVPVIHATGDKLDAPAHPIVPGQTVSKPAQ